MKPAENQLIQSHTFTLPKHTLSLNKTEFYKAHCKGADVNTGTGLFREVWGLKSLLLMTDFYFFFITSMVSSCPLILSSNLHLPLKLTAFRHRHPQIHAV